MVTTLGLSAWPGVARAATFPADGAAWVPLLQGGTPMGDSATDGANEGREIVGSAAEPAIYVYRDATDFFVRLRLTVDVTDGAGLLPHAWGVLIDTDGNLDNYEFALIADGITDNILLSVNTIQATAGSPVDPPETTPSSVAWDATAGGNGRVVASASYYFLDFSVPITALVNAGLGLDLSLRFVGGTSNVAQGLSVDLAGNDSTSDPFTLAAAASDPVAFCTQESTCGAADSGRICENWLCQDGCRNTGNGCPAGSDCTSSGSEAGTCLPSGQGGAAGSAGAGGGDIGGAGGEENQGGTAGTAETGGTPAEGGLAGQPSQGGTSGAAGNAPGGGTAGTSGGAPASGGTAGSAGSSRGGGRAGSAGRTGVSGAAGLAAGGRGGASGATPGGRGGRGGATVAGGRDTGGAGRAEGGSSPEIGGEAAKAGTSGESGAGGEALDQTDGGTRWRSGGYPPFSLGGSPQAAPPGPDITAEGGGLCSASAANGKSTPAWWLGLLLGVLGLRRRARRR
jgi:hypothetical protein